MAKASTVRMRFLFVKARLEWPRTYGHDVHCYEMMRAIAGLGHDISLATDVAPSREAVEGLPLSAQWVLEDNRSLPAPKLSYLQERYRSYWGVPVGRIADLGRKAAEWRADAVVVVGLEILPYLAGPNGSIRIWYAADEWVWHYVSQMAAAPSKISEHVRQAVIKGVYERAYGPLLDRVWVVSESERRAMRIVSGARLVDVVPNGVDTEYFAPTAAAPAPRSAVFWGRLGFGPNVQALDWFATKVWPIVRRANGDATFAILGADPPAEVRAYDGQHGMRVVANPIDLRPHVSACSVVVMPFVSGGGIKNKFLEAASMGRPIVATELAMRGLRSRPPVALADDPAAFAAKLQELWEAPARAAVLGAEARAWVKAHHTWRATAEQALRGLEAQASRG